MRITALRPEDRDRWGVLWGEYLAFYDAVLPTATYDRTWGRLMAGEALHGFAARTEAGVIGITHYLFHVHGWTDGPACYLQDLMVDAGARRGGVGRALIAAVADAARARGAERLYWMTQDHNATARRLYDRIATHAGFIKYDFPLNTVPTPP